MAAALSPRGKPYAALIYAGFGGLAGRRAINRFWSQISTEKPSAIWHRLSDGFFVVSAVHDLRCFLWPVPITHHHGVAADAAVVGAAEGLLITDTEADNEQGG